MSRQEDGPGILLVLEEATYSRMVLGLIAASRLRPRAAAYSRRV